MSEEDLRSLTESNTRSNSFTRYPGATYATNPTWNRISKEHTCEPIRHNDIAFQACVALLCACLAVYIILYNDSTCSTLLCSNSVYIGQFCYYTSLIALFFFIFQLLCGTTFYCNL
ncbi:hypothetical protein DFH11DRAFT_1618871, partial [Phellopilus nigrolimitatus]